MPSFTFFGKVLPERATLGISRPIRTKVQFSDGNVYDIKIHIHVNQVITTVKTSEDSDIDIPSLRNYVEEVIRAMIDMAGYLNGIGYDFEMISVINNDTDESRVFGVQLPITDGDPIKRAARFNELIAYLSKSPFLPAALADLREAIKSPADTGVFSFRALQTIMQAFRNPKESEGQAWKRMIQELNLDNGLRKFMGRHSGDRRHGKPVHISWEDRKAVLRRAWLVVDRYIEYLKRNKKTLPKSKFSIPKY